MKRAVSLLLSAALLLGLLGLLSACRKSAPSVSPSKERTALELAELAYQYAGGDDTRDVEYLAAEDGEDLLAAYLENAYGLDEPWADAAVIRATGASAFEIAVLRMEDSDSAARAAAALMSYTFTRQGDFTGYAPAEADMAANGGSLQDGPFAALFICPDPDGARAAVEAALNGQSVPEPGPEDSAEPITDVKKLRDFLVSDRGMDGAELEKLDDSDRAALRDYVIKTYRLFPDQWKECAIAWGTGDSVFEIAVFRVDAMAESVAGKLNKYLNKREDQFDPSTGNAKLFGQAITIMSSGNAVSYVVMLACPNAEDAALTFVSAAGCFGYNCLPRYRAVSNYPGRYAFTPPNEDDMSLYDTSDILDAWDAGDPSGLSRKDRKIYDAAQKVLEKELKDGMSDYEKEEAIYSWMVQNINYDWTHQNRMKKTLQESFEPYGGLVNHTAVCLGYATTFQLLMDLSGVECITVVGAAFQSTSDHAWNMVCVNGNWYCVDTTWDANVDPRFVNNWCYFNVTSDYMAATDHQWDYANIPEAVTEGGQADA